MENKKKKLLTTASDISVEILSIKKGLVKYEEVKLVKIKSLKYQLTIMKDYVPIIGEIEGSVEIVQKENNLIIENIIGFYIHKHNQLKLFLKEED